MIPKHIITTWICDPARDRYTDRHRDIFEHCLRSWLRLMPDYKISIVTYGSVEGLQTSDGWLNDRLAEGNFIGASQWARLNWLEWQGGIFLDADVEAVRRFDPLLEDDDLFIVGHLGNGQHFANNAVMVSRAHHPMLKVLLDGIKQADPKHPEFGNHTGPFLMTELLRRMGFTGKDEEQTVYMDPLRSLGPIRVARSAVFHPYNWNQNYDPAVHVQPDTLAVHHWASSWRSAAQQTTQAWR